MNSIKKTARMAGSSLSVVPSYGMTAMGPINQVSDRFLSVRKTHQPL
jgi:hypothetical protein